MTTSTTLQAAPSEGYAISNPSLSAGIKESADCTVRALVNATGKPYAEVHAVFADHGRKNRCSFNVSKHLHGICADLGVRARLVRRSGNVERLIRDFPQGKLVVLKRRHAFALLDGVIHDSWEPSTLSHVRLAWKIEAL